MLVTLTYAHDHECEFKGEAFQVRPNVSSGAYPLVIIMCAETGTELTLAKTEVE